MNQMKNTLVEETEFVIQPLDRRKIELFYFFRGIIRIIGMVLPFIKRNTAKRIESIFEDYAGLAYLFDDADVGFFETFILKKGAVDQITKNFEKRGTSWKKDNLINKMSGVQANNKNENFEAINEQFSLDEKKKAALKIVKNDGRVIHFFGKRLRKKDPLFYEKIYSLYQLFCTALPPEKDSTD